MEPVLFYFKDKKRSRLAIQPLPWPLVAKSIEIRKDSGMAKTSYLILWPGKLQCTVIDFSPVKLCLFSQVLVLFKLQFNQRIHIPLHFIIQKSSAIAYIQ
jgi:hypothetical protein